MNPSGSKINWQKLSPWLYTAGLFLIWELSCWLFSIPIYFLPPPTVILHAFQEFQTALWENSIQTLWTTIVGFGIAIVFGMVLGLIIGWSKNIYNGIYPIMVGFNSIPKVAVVPILVLWFGIGWICLLYTSPSPRDATLSRMPSSA